MLKYIKESPQYLLTLSMVVLFSACGDSENTGPNNVESGSEQFVSGTVIKDLNDSVMMNILIAADLNKTNAFGYQSAFGYKSVKISYNTVNQNNESVVASGLLVIPTISDRYKASLASIGKSFSVSMICDNHGTVFTNAEAPTNVAQSTFYPLAVSMVGLAGFAGIYPDYIGYGDSNDEVHPYMLKQASARSGVDMVKASMKYMQDNGIAINHQLYISGYSQGGYNAMAMAESVENGAISTVNLKGVAPMAGPYIVSAFGNEILKSDAIMAVPAFMAYIADSYTYYSNDTVTLDEMIQDSKIPAFEDGLFSGENNATMVHYKLGMGLNTPTNALVKDSFLSAYESNPSEHTLGKMFIENNVGSWNAKSKIKLIHCSNDDVVPVDMTVGVEAILKGYGAANVEKLLIDSVDANYSNNESVHGNCAEPAYQQAIGWFDAIRNGDIK